MLQWLEQNKEMILNGLGLSLFAAVVFGLLSMVIAACLDYAKEAKQIAEDAKGIASYPTTEDRAERDRLKRDRLDSAVEAYFSGIEEASSALKESKALARAIRALLVYSLREAGVAHDDIWTVATVQMKELFGVTEFED